MNPSELFDRYVLLARVVPALIATGPVILLFLLIFPRLSFARILGSAAVVIIFLYIMADIAARQGGAG
jgi:hypothetical protein